MSAIAAIAGIIAADLVHLARNENTSASVKALVGHSSAAKDKPLIVVVETLTNFSWGFMLGRVKIIR